MMNSRAIVLSLGLTAALSSGIASAALGGLGSACNSSNLNDSPIGTNDAYTTGYNTVLNEGMSSGMLGNDLVCSQASGTVVLASTVTGASQFVHVESVTNPTFGVLTSNADGSFTYTPNGGFHGTDSFTYVINDNNQEVPATPTMGNKFTTGPVTVTITVLPPPVLPTLSTWGMVALLAGLGGLAAWGVRRRQIG